MNKRIGIICIVLGICCLLAAAGLVVYNRLEAQNAENASLSMLQNVKEQMADAAQKAPEVDATREMQTALVDGQECVGILSIPVLELELPVLTDWSYEKLKIAPCHYYGSCYEANFVIAAHNYRSHFGRLSELQQKDLVLFTDVSGTTHYYEVVLLETLAPNATEQMITSGFDLSLYTCTPGGGNRVTVRCSIVKK